jgi:ribosome biogenesis protein Nip4
MAWTNSRVLRLQTQKACGYAMKSIKDFVRQFGGSISLDWSLIVGKEDRHFLINESLKKLIMKDFFYAGTYLGKTENGKFFPSFNLLSMIAEKKANKIIVDKKTAWLFICGRDIFKQGITKVMGSKRKGDYALILNQHGECLGFGRILSSLHEEKEGVAVKNISDIGDFLRREKQQV